MATPTFVGIGNHENATAPGALTHWASGHQAGDIAILIASNGSALNTPAGWNVIYKGWGPTSTLYMSAFWKRATSSSEAGVACPGPPQAWAAQMVVYRGCVPSGSPFEVVGAVGGLSASTNTSLTLSGLTTTHTSTTVGLLISKSATVAMSHGWGAPFVERGDTCIGVGSSALTFADYILAPAEISAGVTLSLPAGTKNAVGFLAALKGDAANTAARMSALACSYT